MHRRIQLLVGGVIILALLIAVAYKGVQSTVAFYSPAEVLAAPESFQNKTIRLMALVQPHSTQWDAQAVKLRFQITEDSKHFIPVVFRGVQPDMYREGQGVVVEGQLQPDGTFLASTLLVKHGADYQVDAATAAKIKAKEAEYKAMVHTP
ncbi:MAG TPA: cytochrome c maturation protein CcmE [bacterium]|nr:cytochrome c maturation protein CcmE [bacterium]